MANGKEKSANDVENFSQNLYVECAEKAITVTKIYSKLELKGQCFLGDTSWYHRILYIITDILRQNCLF